MAVGLVKSFYNHAVLCRKDALCISQLYCLDTRRQLTYPFTTTATKNPQKFVTLNILGWLQTSLNVKDSSTKLHFYNISDIEEQVQEIVERRTSNARQW